MLEHVREASGSAGVSQKMQGASTDHEFSHFCFTADLIEVSHLLLVACHEEIRTLRARLLRNACDPKTWVGENQRLQDHRVFQHTDAGGGDFVVSEVRLQARSHDSRGLVALILQACLKSEGPHSSVREFAVDPGRSIAAKSVGVFSDKIFSNTTLPLPGKCRQ